MYPPLVLLDPAMAVILLSIALTFAIIFGFIWAFEKISQQPESHEDEHNGHGA